MISIGNLQINKLFLGNLEVAKAYLGDVEVYGSTKKYMTMTVLEGDAGTTIAPTITGTLSPNLQYRVNNGSWNDFIVGTTADIHAVAGDVVQFKGLNTSGLSTSDKNYMHFSISGNPVSLSGNIMSLIDGVGDSNVVPCNYCFYKMFSKSNVKTVSLDFLPATTLTTWCYSDLFSESLLENAPELPALTMQENCYRGMFYGCQHFTQVTELQSTTLANNCYQGMFQNCTALTTAPALPAMTLKERCYYYMFYGCSSLNQAPMLPATTLAPYCYNNMFCLCTSLTTTPELPATTLSPYCYAYMFYDCSALVNVHELPATTIAQNCYRSMFYRCTALTQSPALPATTLANSCYAFMFWGCTSLTTAPELPATELTEYCYNQMFYGDSSLNYVKSLATNITATSALNYWLGGVAASGTFVKPAGVSYPTGASGIPSGWTVVEEKPKPEGKYMTITVLDGDAGTTIAPTVTGSIPNLNLQYRINSNGDWTDFIVGTTADIQVVSGDWVQFKGVNESGISDSTQNYLNFSISGNPVALSGNVMSLIDGVGDVEVIPCSYCFLNLFKDTKIKTVTKDFLSATTLVGGCYSYMFIGCTSLTQAPELPVTTLYNYCYSGMFSGCTSLATAPALPATTLIQGCYQSMFQGCTSLTTSPALPATTLATYCYDSMFNGCTALTTAPELSATTLDERCYNSMFYGCTSLVNAPELPATTLANLCYQSMFEGCTALTTAPALPATTLASNCYQNMFRDCTALTQAPELPATTLKGNCYNAMFYGCTSLVTAPVLPATMLTVSCYQGMFRGCTTLNYVKCLANRVTSMYIRNWLDGVASSGTFVKPSGVSYETGPSGIPSGWTIEEI